MTQFANEIELDPYDLADTGPRTFQRGEVVKFEVPAHMLGVAVFNAATQQGCILICDCPEGIPDGLIHDLSGAIGERNLKIHLLGLTPGKGPGHTVSLSEPLPGEGVDREDLENTTRILALRQEACRLFLALPGVDLIQNFGGIPLSAQAVTFNTRTGELKTSLADADDIVFDDDTLPKLPQ